MNFTAPLLLIVLVASIFSLKVQAASGSERTEEASATTLFEHQSALANIGEDPLVPLVRDGGVAYREDGTVFSGQALEFDKAGNLIAEGPMENGLKHGKWITYYASLCKRTEQNYSGGELDGPYLRFDEAGKLIQKGTHEKGKKTGRWIDYRPDGSRIKECNYESGEVTTWDENEVVRTRISFLTREGVQLNLFAVHYNESGQKTRSVEYAPAGIPEKAMTWYPNENLKEVISYKNGAPHGEKICYDTDGNQIDKQAIRHGEAPGNQKPGQVDGN